MHLKKDVWAKEGAGMENNKKAKIELASIITVIILVVALLAVNVATAFLPDSYTKFDMSSKNIYKISEESRSFLSKLDKDVTLYILNADGTNKAFEKFVKEYIKCSDKIEVAYDTDSNYSAYSLRVESDARSEVIDSSNMFYYENPKLGRLSISDYEYYVEYFSASEQYADYLNELLYNTSLYFYGDAMIPVFVVCVLLAYLQFLPEPKVQFLCRCY